MINPVKPNSTPYSSEISTAAHAHSSQKTNEVSEKMIKSVSDQAPKIPQLIMLSGTSTAGKSSIMSAFVKLHSNAKDLGIDDFSVIRTVQLLQTDPTCAKEYAILSKVVDSKHIRQLFFPNPTVIFKNDPTVTEADKKAVMDLIDPENKSFWEKVGGMLFDQGNVSGPNENEENQAHFKAIVNLEKTGKTVIFDTSKSDEFIDFLKNNPCNASQVQRFLVYAPLTHLLERLEGRNKKAIEEGDDLNKRSYVNIIDQFMRNYHPLKAVTDVTVDTITRADIEKVFRDYEIRIGVDNKDSTNPLSLKNVLDHFGFKPTDNQVAITHEFQKFDGIFRTAQQNASQSATQLMSHTWLPFISKKSS